MNIVLNRTAVIQATETGATLSQRGTAHGRGKQETNKQKTITFEQKNFMHIVENT